MEEVAGLAAPSAPTGGVALCHPHPLYGGDMDNPVVVRAAEVCRDAGLATLRFNLRGGVIGYSFGAWVAGRVGCAQDWVSVGTLYPLGEAVAAWTHAFSEASPGKARRGGGAG